MKILTIGNALSPHILNRAKLFLKFDCKNKILSEENVQDIGIEVISPFDDWAGKSGWIRPYYFLKNCIQEMKILKAEDYDILHIHYPSNYLAWIASLISSKPIVVVLMGGDILFEQHQHLPWYHKSLVKQTVKRADLVVAKSPYIKERAIKLCGNLPRIISCIFGVSENFLKKIEYKKKNPLVFLSSRSVKPFYNLDKIIDVIWHLNNKQVNINLVIVCFNPDNQYLDLLQNKVKNMDLESKVSFLPSVRSAEELLSLYQRANFVIALPQSDGVPQSALEGMAQGCINILPENNSYSDIFNNQNSILVNGDPQEMAEQILKKLNSKEIQKIAIEARKFIESYGRLDKNISYLKMCSEEIVATYKHKRKNFHATRILFLLVVYFVDQFFMLGIRNKLRRK